MYIRAYLVPPSGGLPGPAGHFYRELSAQRLVRQIAITLAIAHADNLKLKILHHLFGVKNC